MSPLMSLPREMEREMDDLDTKTRKELLEMAKAAGIKGRHELSKEELIAELKLAAPGAEDQAEEDQEPLDSEKAKEAESAPAPAPKKKMSGMPRRPSGNVPFRCKPYYVDPDLVDENEEKISKAPNQVRLIIKSMLASGRTNPLAAALGETIVSEAKASGILSTTIPSANLFAYYARQLQSLGVVYVGNAPQGAKLVGDEGEEE